MFVISAKYTVSWNHLGQKCCWVINLEYFTNMEEDGHHVQQILFKWVADESLFPVNGTAIVETVATSVGECAMICHATSECQRFYIKEDVVASESRCIMALV